MTTASFLYSLIAVHLAVLGSKATSENQAHKQNTKPLFSRWFYSITAMTPNLSQSSGHRSWTHSQLVSFPPLSVRFTCHLHWYLRFAVLSIFSLNLQKALFKYLFYDIYSNRPVLVTSMLLYSLWEYKSFLDR